MLNGYYHKLIGQRIELLGSFGFGKFFDIGTNSAQTPRGYAPGSPVTGILAYLPFNGLRFNAGMGYLITDMVLHAPLDML